MFTVYNLVELKQVRCVVMGRVLCLIDYTIFILSLARLNSPGCPVLRLLWHLSKCVLPHPRPPADCSYASLFSQWRCSAAARFSRRSDDPDIPRQWSAKMRKTHLVLLTKIHWVNSYGKIGATTRLSFQFIGIINERAALSIQNEPTPWPGMKRCAQLVQIAKDKRVSLWELKYNEKWDF